VLLRYGEWFEVGKYICFCSMFAVIYAHALDNWCFLERAEELAIVSYGYINFENRVLVPSSRSCYHFCRGEAFCDITVEFRHFVSFRRYLKEVAVYCFSSIIVPDQCVERHVQTID
jgi:hypothetical protein